MSEKVIVTVNEGKVRGYKKKSIYSDVEYYSFLGIPYGQSTAGRARFKEPVKVKPWNGTFDASQEKEGCIQFSVLAKLRVCGSEDCLYNNIYTPKLPCEGDTLKAVLVNIHPGGLYHGSPDPTDYGSPEYLIQHDIVYVGISYRLGILGGLNLNMNECSGNQNLKDIILSLRWIKDNISNFGGDPENVTIMGSSSGSGLVHYLLLSPLAKGLYHKAIFMGMYVFNPVLIMPNENITTAFNIALNLGYKGELHDHKKLLNFYKKLPMLRLIALRTEDVFKKEFLPVYPSSPFMPTYEASENSENSALPLPTKQLIPSTNRVPIMVGFCEREAVMAFLRPNKEKVQEALHSYTVLRQNKLGWGENLTSEDLKQIQQKVESFYINDRAAEYASLSTQCDILTDITLSDVYDTLINIISADLPSSVYVYKFRYSGNLSFMKQKISPLLNKPLQGAFHGDDFAYISYTCQTAGDNMESVTPQDRKIIDTLTSAITTFAKTGNPNFAQLGLNWKPTTQDNPCYLSIDENLEVKDELINGKRTEFWHELKQLFKAD